jgi:hypothetical protein
MEQMDIEVEASRIEDVTVFRLKGPFTLSTMFDFQADLRKPGQKGAIVDLSGVPYMDSLYSRSRTPIRCFRYLPAGMMPKVASKAERRQLQPDRAG